MAVLALEDNSYEVEGLGGEWTWERYQNWDGPRLELIDGEPYLMSSPGWEHQMLAMSISAQFFNFLRGKPCKVASAPLDVKLFPGDTKRERKGKLTLVQPDILVVCDQSKTENGKAVLGAPDLVVEILSPSSKLMDLRVKKELYTEAGVKEYWIVDRFKKVLVFTRAENGGFSETLYQAAKGSDGASRVEVPVSLFPGLTVMIDQEG